MTSPTSANPRPPLANNKEKQVTYVVATATRAFPRHADEGLVIGMATARRRQSFQKFLNRFGVKAV
jgi:hypothetical protein